MGLLITAFWFGFRHGIDWDHIAAISDITSSQEERRQSMLYGTLYALGHASVVFVLLVWVILRWSPSASSYSAVLAPVITVVLATALAGEVFGPTFFTVSSCRKISRSEALLKP